MAWAMPVQTWHAGDAPVPDLNMVLKVSVRGPITHGAVTFSQGPTSCGTSSSSCARLRLDARVAIPDTAGLAGQH